MQEDSRLASLFKRRQSGVQFSLDRIRKLCVALGNPEKDLRCIHVAGTNGKGSVCAMAAAILQEAGMRTGLFTSPHLIRFHERFRMNGKDITDAELYPLMDRILSIAEDSTFFEIATALAFLWFREKRAEIALLETGMGGRLDATNIIKPQVSLISSISLDHQSFLGSDLSSIAREKAGIFKSGVPAWSVPQEDEILNVLKDEARARGTSLSVISDNDGKGFESPLAGKHQRENMALAITAVLQICPNLSASMIQRGLSKTRWQGRCQMVRPRNNLPEALVDGAHNVGGLRALRNEVERRWGRGKITLILGMLADKSLQEMARELEGLATEVWIVPVSSERSASPDMLARYFSNSRPFQGLNEAWVAAKDTKRPLVITGSLFLAGEALQLADCSKVTLHPNELAGKILPTS